MPSVTISRYVDGDRETIKVTVHHGQKCVTQLNTEAAAILKLRFLSILLSILVDYSVSYHVKPHKQIYMELLDDSIPFKASV